MIPTLSFITVTSLAGNFQLLHTNDTNQFTRETMGELSFELKNLEINYTYVYTSADIITALKAMSQDMVFLMYS